MISQSSDIGKLVTERFPNKTENPSKDALDKTANYANCDQGNYINWNDQTNRSDHTDQGDQTDQCDQTDQGDQTDKGDQTDWGDHGDQTNH